MKVAICGSHSTGKTTLLEDCCRSLDALLPSRLAVIDEVARKVIADGFLLNQDASVESYCNYVHRQLFSERETGDYEHVLSDRCLLDLLAYMKTNGDPRIPAHFVAMVEEIVWLEKQHFDVYCYLPIEFPLCVDDVRPADESYRLAVDASLQKLFQAYSITPVIIRGSIEARKQTMLELFDTRGSYNEC